MSRFAWRWKRDDYLAPSWMFWNPMSGFWGGAIIGAVIAVTIVAASLRLSQ